MKMMFYQYVVVIAFIILSFASSVTGKFSITKRLPLFFCDHVKVRLKVQGMRIPRFMKCAPVYLSF